MTNESKHELAAADETLKSLESKSAATATDAKVHQLGQLLRESSGSNLPASDPALREQLNAKLESLSESGLVSRKDVQPKPPLKGGGNGRGWGLWITIAATITILIGGTLTWTSFQNGHRHANRKVAQTSIDELIRSETTWDSLTNENLRSSDEQATRAIQLANLESQLKSQETKKSLKTGEASGPSVGTPVDLFNVTARGRNSFQKLEPSIDGLVNLNDSGITLSSGYNSNLGIQNKSEGVLTPYSSNLSMIVGDSGQPQVRLSNGGSVHFADAAEWESKSEQRRKYSGIRLWGDTSWDEEKESEVHKFSLPREEYHRENSGEQYDPIVENQFIEAIGEQALSTFSIDVDTASYSNMRRFISSRQLPPPNSIRLEELINYFHYDYPQPNDDKPFRVAMEVAECPWQPAHRLVRIGIKGKEVHRNERPASNLVFLLDVSGSMKDQDKLPLLQRGLQMMLDRLGENDRVSIVTYASNAGVRLEPTSGDQKIKIRNVIDNLAADGSTNGSAGIEIAYDLAANHFIKDGTNRVILATDGDLNVGVTDDESLVKLIKNKASEGVFLTVLGFGTGNLKDSKMEKLADNGNGVYAYIDSMREARKVLVEQMSGSLVTIAKDVKLQVEFNPAQVKGYRLLGYENRKMANADFDNDKKDAGEIGAGHTVTALYEIVPSGIAQSQTLSTNLKYQQAEKEKPPEKKPLSKATESGDLLTLAVRYKLPDATESERNEFTLADSKAKFYEASTDFRFAAAVASFGMRLRNSQYRGEMDLKTIESIASKAIGEDPSGYRIEFVDLVRQVTETADK